MTLTDQVTPRRGIPEEEIETLTVTVLEIAVQLSALRDRLQRVAEATLDLVNAIDTQMAAILEPAEGGPGGGEAVTGEPAPPPPPFPLGGE